MTEPDYVAPTTVAAAVAALHAARGSVQVLAGGTDLLVQMRSGRTRPDLIVDVKRIPDFIGVRTDAGGFLIGAATPCAMLGEHAALAAAWPGVVEAATLIGSTQVQGRASLGGNLCNASPAADSRAGAGRRGRHLRDRGPDGSARGRRSKACRPARAATRWRAARWSWRSVCPHARRARAMRTCA